jgi:hypothetical protein
MSFDVFLQRFENGQPARADHDAVRAVLATRNFTDLSGDGYYNVRFQDGNDVEFSAGGLRGEADFSSCTFFIHGMSSELIRFMWEVADAGAMAVLATVEDFRAILTPRHPKEDLPQDLLPPNYPEPVVCESPAELESFLLSGYLGWKKYRDQVVGDTPLT